MKTGKFFLLLISLIPAACGNNPPSMTDQPLPAKRAHYIPAAGEKPLTFDTISYEHTDLLAPGRGANSWYTYTQAVQIPVPGVNTWALDNDTRFLWAKFEPGKKGEYVWTEFDKQINYSIDHGQRFSFGIMAVCSSCIIGDIAGDGNQDVDGSGLGYPAYVHAAMQSEPAPDWNYAQGKTWVPNWNSESFLEAWENLLKAVAQHIATKVYKGVAYSKVIYHIDVRGYGNWGEWHTYPWRDYENIPAATKASVATLRRIITSYIDAFPDYPLIAMVNTFTINGDAATLDKNTAEVAYYALTAKNKWGPLGWRSDHLGSEITDQWVPYETHLNKHIFQGVSLKNLITERWKTAPVIGEPLGTLNEVNDNGRQCPFYNLLNEVKLHHVSQFSNENLVSKGMPCIDSNYRAASKASGYRLQITGGAITAAIWPGSKWNITLDWNNNGVAPVYENWNTVFELRNASGKVVWSERSSFVPRLFLPGSASVTDHFTMSTVILPGSYELTVCIRDPLGYRKPLPLANAGMLSDGSYPVGNIVVGKKKK